MNSSISASERRRWRQVLTLYLASLLVLGAAVGGLIVTLDPYDTGRFSLFASKGVPSFGPRLTAASRARRRAIDTAIIGNSTIQLIDPARVSAESGRHVVSLTIPGTGPQEQLVIAQYFLEHHQAGEMRGLVFGIDSTWCNASGRLALTNPFPFWLYSQSDLDYLGNMMRLAAARAAIQKAKLLLGYAPAARADGYDDYDTGRTWDAAAARQRLSQAAVDATVPDQDAAPEDIAAAPLLAQFLTRLPPGVPVVLVVPPRYRDPEAVPSAHAVARQRACADAYRKRAQARANTAVLDFIAQPEIAGPDEFWDPIHYRASVGRRMEAAIAAALREGE
jgi:hypothetical protein